MASPILACRGRRVDRGVASCFRGRRSGLGFVRSPSTFRAWKGSGHSFICAKAETKEAPRRGASFVSSHGGRTRARTWDPLIKSQLLYQLSYAPHWPEAARLYQAGYPLSSRRAAGKFTVLKDPLRKLRDQYPPHPEERPQAASRRVGTGHDVAMTARGLPRAIETRPAGAPQHEVWFVGVARRLRVAQRCRGNCASR